MKTIIFLLSLFFSLIFTYISILIFPKINLLDYPSSVKSHKNPMPVSGGIGIFFAYIISLFFSYKFFSFFYKQAIFYHLKLIIFTSSLIIILGLIDDIRKINAVIKFFCLIFLSILLVSFGITFKIFPYYFINQIITCFWIVLIISAFNAIDNMDGLASGTAIIALFFFFLLSVFTNQFFISLISLALLGSLIGFFIFNGFRAKIYLGDSGSFFIGFILALISIMGTWSQNKFKNFLIPILILLYPLFDLLFVILIRFFQRKTKSIKEAILYCGCDHSSHLLLNYGFSKNKSVFILYFFNIIFSLSALFLKNSNLFQNK